jgi:nitroreductase
MDFEKVIQNRRSIRKYKADPVPKAGLRRILHAARWAPTWANMQGVKIIVLEQPDHVKACCEAIGQKWLKAVPMLLIVCIEPNDSGTNASGIQYFPVDAAIIMEHIVLAATNEGLGTCWIGWFDEEKVKAVVGVPKATRIIAITPVGIPDTSPKPTPRRPFKEWVFSEQFGTILQDPELEKE